MRFLARIPYLFILLTSWGVSGGNFPRGNFPDAIILLSVKKKKKKGNQYYKLLFFKINLLFVPSNQIFTYRNLNLVLTTVIYWSSFLEVQWRHMQTIKTHTLFFCVWKDTTLKPLKVATAKTLFPVCMLLVQLASFNAFYSMWLLEDIFFINVYSYFFQLFQLLLSIVKVFRHKTRFYTLFPL